MVGKLVLKKRSAISSLFDLRLAHDRSLSSHMRKHSEAPRTCTICKKVKPNRHALRMHMKQVHTDVIHECFICGKGFKYPPMLKDHIAAHSGPASHECVLCSKTFTSKFQLQSHKKREHPKE